MIEFVNIKSGERVKLTRPHQIGAFINSSDLHVNSTKGQDFGWRLAPSVIVRLDAMRQDVVLLEEISRRTGVPVDELTTIHLVQHISYEENLAEQAKTMRAEREPEYKKTYEAEIEALKGGTETPIITSGFSRMAPVEEGAAEIANVSLIEPSEWNDPVATEETPIVKEPTTKEAEEATQKAPTPKTTPKKK